MRRDPPSQSRLHLSPSSHHARKLLLERRRFKPGLTLEDTELRAIEQPALMVNGTADPVGSVDIWKGFMSRLPRGEFLLVNEGGHLPW
jgi:pimeloyl-ACP methyl ester carboxylesterase